MEALETKVLTVVESLRADHRQNEEPIGEIYRSLKHSTATKNNEVTGYSVTAKYKARYFHFDVSLDYLSSINPSVLKQSLDTWVMDVSRGTSDERVAPQQAN